MLDDRFRFDLLCLAFVAGLLAAPAAAPAQAEGRTGEPAPDSAAATLAPGPDVDELHDELRAVRAAMETALNERDLDALVEHVTSDVVFTTMNGDMVRGPDGIRDYFAEMMEGEDRVVDSVTTHFQPDDLSILYGSDLAISFGSSQDHYDLSGGEEFDVEARWTATLVRSGGGWKIAAFHYSTDMFDNPVLGAQRDVLVKVAVGAAVIAFVVALLLGRVLGKRAAAG